MGLRSRDKKTYNSEVVITGQNIKDKLDIQENKCLYCYKEINSIELETLAGIEGYHKKCSKSFFGNVTPPVLDFTETQILQLAEQVIKSQRTVTGVQPKLSLGLSKEVSTPNRLTIVGLWGSYILKPQTTLYSNLPEIEDLTMHLAEISKIKTVPHSLIKLKSGQLAYITKRVDRNNGEKSHMEDMCQLTERLTEDKYKGSHEQVAKTVSLVNVKFGSLTVILMVSIQLEIPSEIVTVKEAANGTALLPSCTISILKLSLDSINLSSVILISAMALEANAGMVIDPEL